jgi:hypothetical protein
MGGRRKSVNPIIAVLANSVNAETLTKLIRLLLTRATLALREWNQVGSAA